MFGFTGAVTSSLTSFVLPGLLFLHSGKVPGKTAREVLAAKGVVAVGTTIAVFGFASALVRTLHGG